MGQVSLREIDEADYPGFIDDVYSSYAEERALADYISLEEALADSNKLKKEDLAAGFSSPNDFFYYIYYGDVKVGSLWLTVNDKGASPFLFVSDLIVYKPFRRLGYASAALLEAERVGKEAGCVRIDLNVFARSSAARALYTKLGYSSSTVQMNKRLL